jgi:hypothetical protein
MVGMKTLRDRRVLVVSVIALAFAWTWVWTRSSAVAPALTPVLTVDASQPGSSFARGAVGLSLETRELSSGRLTATHRRLVRLMRLLGPSVLRIGAGSVDFSWWTSRGEPPPAWARVTVIPGDLTRLRGLLSATGWRVLLGVDLGHFDPARAADEARHARSILGHHLLGIEIGNEPNDYGHEPPGLRPPTYGVGEYLGEAQAYRQALSAATPGLAVYGPALTEANSWLNQMGSTAQSFTALTQHYYPIKACVPAKLGEPLRPTAAELLSPAVRQREDEVLASLVNAGSLFARPTRIGETNSVACPGDAAASPGFAGALWALDWTLRAASSGATGVSFHGALGVCSVYRESPICASSDRGAQTGAVAAQPEYYGLLAARQLEVGRFVPTRLSAPLQPSVTTWATRAPDGTIRIVLDNLATAGSTQPLVISTAGYTVTQQTLSAPAFDASRGISLGGAEVTSAGRWRPKLARPSRGRRSVRIDLRPASAVIVTLRR